DLPDYRWVPASRGRCPFQHLRVVGSTEPPSISSRITCDERIRQQHQSLFPAKRKVSTSTFLFCSWKAHTAKCAFSSASFLSHGSGSLPNSSRCDFVILPRNQGVSTPAPCSFTSVTRTFSTRPGTPNSLPIGAKTFLITNYPQPRNDGTNQEHAAVS